MFFVFLVDLSKATLRCYTSICDGIIFRKFDLVAGWPPLQQPSQPGPTTHWRYPSSLSPCDKLNERKRNTLKRMKHPYYWLQVVSHIYDLLQSFPQLGLSEKISFACLHLPRPLTDQHLYGAIAGLLKLSRMSSSEEIRNLTLRLVSVREKLKMTGPMTSCSQSASGR